MKKNITFYIKKNYIKTEEDYVFEKPNKILIHFINYDMYIRRKIKSNIVELNLANNRYLKEFNDWVDSRELSKFKYFENNNLGERNPWSNPERISLIYSLPNFRKIFLKENFKKKESWYSDLVGSEDFSTYWLNYLIVDSTIISLVSGRENLIKIRIN